jgi:hypothetical protein
VDTSDSLLVLVAAAFVVALVFLRPRGAQSGTFADIPARLKKLRQSKDANAFLGFYTRDENTLYFIYLEGVFFLDYELNTPKKTKFEEAFRQAAVELGFPMIDATYGEHRVLRVKIDDSETNAAEVGFKFAEKVFGLDGKTVLEFLP